MEEIFCDHQKIFFAKNFLGLGLKSITAVFNFFLSANTLNFFKAYHDKIIDYYKKIYFIEGLEYLMSYDIDNNFTLEVI